MSSEVIAKFIAPKAASQAISRVSQVSVSNTPNAQISFQNAVSWEVYDSKWGIDDLECWRRMYARVDERAFGDALTTEARADGEIWRRLLNNKSCRFVRRYD